MCAFNIHLGRSLYYVEYFMSVSEYTVSWWVCLPGVWKILVHSGTINVQHAAVQSLNISEAFKNLLWHYLTLDTG